MSIRIRIRLYEKISLSLAKNTGIATMAHSFKGEIMKALRKYVAMICLSLSLLSPFQKAQSGILIAAASRTESGVAVGLVFVILGIIYQNAGIIVLEERADYVTALGNNLAEQFPFIDSAEVINTIATKATERFEASGSDEVNVKFSAEETKAILAPANLSSEEEALVVEALK